MEALFKVIYTGKLRAGASKEDVCAAFIKRFGVSDEKAQRLLSASGEVLLKKELNQAKAESYREALEKIGMLIRLEPVNQEPALSGLTLEPVEGVESQSETRDEPTKSVCPKCGSDRLDGDNCLECGVIISKYLSIEERNGNDAEPADNPYAVPQSDLVVEAEAGDFFGPVGVSVGYGWSWITKGFWHFRQNPFAWIIAMVVWIGIAMVCSLIPIIGSLAVSLFTPVILAGFMLGAQAQDQGRDFAVSHLFAGFSNHTGQLVLVGLLYLIGFFVIGAAMMLVAGGAFFNMMGGMEGQAAPAPEALAAMVGSGAFILMMLLGVCLTLPLVMAYWFAPALVALEGMSAITAMKMSFVGCWKNMLPFLLYGLVALVFLLLAMVPVGLGLLIVLPLLTASIYVSFKDIYYR